MWPLTGLTRITSESFQSHAAPTSKLSTSTFTLNFPSHSCFRSNCYTLQLRIKLCFVSSHKHIRWGVIGHRLMDDSICSSHLNRVQARPGQGPLQWGVSTSDSHGTSRWLKGWPSMAIQSAAIIQGGPTSSCKQVASVIIHSLSKTNVSCEYQLWYCIAPFCCWRWRIWNAERKYNDD